MGTCDVCEATDVEVSRVWMTGIETFACAKCRGVEEPDDDAICTCTYSSVNTATIDPPDILRRDPWCPRHGKDPDAEYERIRDDAAWERDNG